MTSATRQDPSLPVRSTFFVVFRRLSAGQGREQRFRLKDYKLLRAAHDRALGLQKTDRYPWAPVTDAQRDRQRDLPSLAEKGGWSCH